MPIGAANHGTTTAQLGKTCAACRVWNKGPFLRSQQCFKCHSVLYQGSPQDKYPGKHHRLGKPSPKVAKGPQNNGGGPGPRPPAGQNNQQLQKRIAELESQLQEQSNSCTNTIEDEPDNANLADTKQELRQAEQRLNLARSAKKPCQEEIDLYERRVKQLTAEVGVLRQALDDAKPTDQLYKEAANHQKQLKVELDRRQQTMEASRKALELAQLKFKEDEQLHKEADEKHKQAQQRTQAAAAKAAKGEGKLASGPDSLKTNVMGALQSSLPGLTLLPQGSSLQNELEQVLAKWQAAAAEAYALQQVEQQEKQQKQDDKPKVPNNEQDKGTPSKEGCTGQATASLEFMEIDSDLQVVLQTWKDQLKRKEGESDEDWHTRKKTKMAAIHDANGIGA